MRDLRAVVVRVPGQWGGDLAGSGTCAPRWRGVPRWRRGLAGEAACGAARSRVPSQTLAPPPITSRTPGQAREARWYRRPRPNNRRPCLPHPSAREVAAAVGEQGATIPPPPCLPWHAHGVLLSVERGHEGEKKGSVPCASHACGGVRRGEGG